MIVGLAYYYTSDYLTSLKYLKDAIRDEQNLVIELQNHLVFIISSIKLLLFMITKEEYEKIISTIKPDKHISFHIEIDKAIEDLKEKIFKTENLELKNLKIVLNLLYQILMLHYM